MRLHWCSYYIGFCNRGGGGLLILRRGGSGGVLGRWWWWWLMALKACLMGYGGKETEEDGDKNTGAPFFEC